MLRRNRKQSTPRPPLGTLLSRLEPYPNVNSLTQNELLPQDRLHSRLGLPDSLPSLADPRDSDQTRLRPQDRLHNRLGLSDSLLTRIGHGNSLSTNPLSLRDRLSPAAVNKGTQTRQTSTLLNLDLPEKRATPILASSIVLEKDSIPLSSSSAGADYPNRKRSLKSLSSSTTVPHFPSPKRTKLSSFTSKNSSPLAETTLNPTSSPKCGISDRAGSTLTSNRLRQPLIPTTDHRERIQISTSAQPRKRNSHSPTWAGQKTTENPPWALSQSAVRKRSNASMNMLKTSPAVNSSSDPLDEHLPGSPIPNGNEFSKVKPSTSTTSSPLSIALQLMKRERLALEMQRSALESLTRNGVLALTANGYQPGTSRLALLPSLSPTEPKNSVFTASSSVENSEPSSLNPIPELSCLTPPYVTTSKAVNLSSSTTTTSSFVSTQPSSCPTESNPLPRKLPVAASPTPQDGPLGAKSTSAIALTQLAVVPPPTLTADTVTSAKPAKGPATGKSSTKTRPYSEAIGSRPKYLRYNLWNAESSFFPHDRRMVRNCSSSPSPSSF